MDISPQKLSEVLAQALAQDVSSQHSERIGYIETMKDGVAKIVGMHGVAMGEVLVVHDGEPAQLLAMDLDTEAVYALVLDPATELREGTAIKATGKSLSLPVGPELLGRVIDPLGRALDNLGVLKTKTTGRLESAAPSVMERKSVDRPLHTGVLAIDAMIPIGRGQRELIIGDRQTGKTSIALSAILEQAKTGVKCVYVAIGQRQSAVAEFIEKLRTTGALDYTVVINASAAMPATLQYLAPYAGAAVGEYFMHQGQTRWSFLTIFQSMRLRIVKCRYFCDVHLDEKPILVMSSIYIHDYLNVPHNYLTNVEVDHSQHYRLLKRKPVTLVLTFLPMSSP